MVCSVDDCAVAAKTAGLCGAHYQRRRLERRRAAGLICKVEECGVVAVVQDLCAAHYNRVRSGYPLHLPVRGRGVARLCEVEGCGRTHAGHGLCTTHLRRQRHENGLSDDIPISQSNGCRPPGYGRGWIDSNGYRSVMAPGHPNADAEGRILEHRLVMSQLIGRALLPGETVHHKNGRRADNRPENLELWCKPPRTGVRADDLVTDALEVLRRYAPQLLKE